MEYIYNTKTASICLENSNVCLVFYSTKEACEFLKTSKDTLIRYKKIKKELNGFIVKDIKTFCSIKKCHKCNTLIHNENYVIGGESRDIASICKSCKKTYYEKSKHISLHKQKQDYINNKEKYALRSKIYYEKNKKKILDFSRWYRKNVRRNQALRTMHESSRRFLKIASKTAFIGYKDQIKKIYKKASELSNTTGVQYHVDHIIPLKHKDVCGLHVPWNLQILTAEENLKKSNKFQGGLA